ncbi:hypothetical protein M231_04881 [Tremella mesenterica]|uniref:Essential protein Yae1 N-terminal domain-containing protein n=1 Tax=Tremella mesenterica TaxID=5217 RepID=A0A4Q1BJX0_TREME|nr:hypothetical protein M231_04881 [Tremella mesenterica]
MDIDDLDNDEDDILDDLVNLESRFYTQGYEEGHAHGALHGIYEGRALGQEKAFELWEEVGYYEGFAEVWVELLSESKMGNRDLRARNHASQLLELITSFPRINPSSNSSSIQPSSQTFSSSLRNTDTSSPGPTNSGSNHQPLPLNQNHPITHPPLAKETSNSHFTTPDSERPTRPHHVYISQTFEPDSHTHPTTHDSDEHAHILGDLPPKMENRKVEGKNSQSPELDLLALLNSIRAKYKLLCASLNLHPRLVQSSTNTGKSDPTNSGNNSGIDTPFTSGMGGLLSGVDTKKLGF